MTASTFAFTAPLIINGKASAAAKPNPTYTELKTAGITLLGAKKNMASVKLNNNLIILRAVRIIIRASGRKRRHLARYLTGKDEHGAYWEIFLGIVNTFKNSIFQARIRLQVGLLKLSLLALVRGLGAEQRLKVIYS